MELLPPQHLLEACLAVPQRPLQAVRLLLLPPEEASLEAARPPQLLVDLVHRLLHRHRVVSLELLHLRRRVCLVVAVRPLRHLPVVCLEVVVPLRQRRAMGQAPRGVLLIERPQRPGGGGHGAGRGRPAARRVVAGSARLAVCGRAAGVWQCAHEYA